MKGFSVCIDRHTIATCVQELGHAISQDYADREVTCIGVLKGVTPFFADLLRTLTMPVTMDTIRLSSYGAARNTSHHVRILKNLDSCITGKHVLVIEEIVDSGCTLAFLLKHLAEHNPASLHVVTLLNKEARREVHVPITYEGMRVEDAFLIGYGLDLDETCRNLPDILATD